MRLDQGGRSGEYWNLGGTLVRDLGGWENGMGKVRGMYKLRTYAKSSPPH
jgi:hypothetical protein